MSREDQPDADRARGRAPPSPPSAPAAAARADHGANDVDAPFPLGDAPRAADGADDTYGVELGAPRLFAHACGYLPDRTAVTEARFFARLDPHGYGRLLHDGYRRFGELVFRPRCPSCSLCISYRVLVRELRMSRRLRRAQQRNRHVHVEIGRARADAETVEVANAFHRHRGARKGWPETQYTEASYDREFLGGPRRAVAVRYRMGGRLVGVGLLDDLPDGVSAIIFHYHESWSPQSPGAFNVLTLIERARRRGVPYLYLGYWVPGSRSTSYKAEFRPGEILTPLGWRRLQDDQPVDRPPGPWHGWTPPDAAEPGATQTDPK